MLSPNPTVDFTCSAGVTCVGITNFQSFSVFIFPFVIKSLTSAISPSLLSFKANFSKFLTPVYETGNCVANSISNSLIFLDVNYPTSVLAVPIIAEYNTPFSADSIVTSFE